MSDKKLHSRLITRSLIKLLIGGLFVFGLFYLFLVNFLTWPSTTCLIASAVSTAFACGVEFIDNIADLNERIKRGSEENQEV